MRITSQSEIPMRDGELFKESLLQADCLSLDKIQTFVEGSVSESVQTHIEHCPACQAEAALMTRFLRPEVTPGEQGAVKWTEQRVRKGLRVATRPRRHWNITIAGALACAAAIVLAIGVASWRNTAPTKALDRSNEVEIFRAASVSDLSPSGDLSTEPRELTWRGGSNGSRFRVELLQVDGKQLWTGVTSTQSITLPNNIRRLFLPYKTIRWQVKLLDPSGNITALSPVAHFRYSPANSKE